jgi:hypothetical protein
MDNLQAQYDEVTDYLEGYWKFVQAFNPRFSRLMVGSPGEYYRLNVKALKTVRRFDPLSEKTQDMIKNVVLALATEEEKRNPYYAVATSEYPTDALSGALMARFPDFSFDKIKKLHDAKQTHLARFNIRQLLGVFFATSALLLKSIPKSVVESWGWNYAGFEAFVLWATVVLVGYFFLILVYPWIKYQAARNRSRRVGDILEYVVIKNG